MFGPGLLPQLILSMIQINREVNLLFTVGFPQLSEEQIAKKFYLF